MPSVVLTDRVPFGGLTLLSLLFALAQPVGATTIVEVIPLQGCSPGHVEAGPGSPWGNSWRLGTQSQLGTQLCAVRGHAGCSCMRRL